jgi:hypothetical protein
VAVLNLNGLAAGSDEGGPQVQVVLAPAAIQLHCVVAKCYQCIHVASIAVSGGAVVRADACGGGMEGGRDGEGRRRKRGSEWGRGCRCLLRRPLTVVSVPGGQRKRRVKGGGRTVGERIGGERSCKWPRSQREERAASCGSRKLRLSQPSPASLEAQGVSIVSHVLHVREARSVDDGLAICVVVAVAIGAVLAAQLPVVIQAGRGRGKGREERMRERVRG